jgi:magnesium chelatase family protein
LPGQIERYLSRVSGPLIDRIDIHIEVPPVPWKQLRSVDDGTSSADLEGASTIAAQHLAEANCTRGILAEALSRRAGRAA